MKCMIFSDIQHVWLDKNQLKILKPNGMFMHYSCNLRSILRLMQLEICILRPFKQGRERTHSDVQIKSKQVRRNRGIMLFITIFKPTVYKNSFMSFDIWLNKCANCFWNTCALLTVKGLKKSEITYLVILMTCVCILFAQQWFCTTFPFISVKLY